MAEVMDQLRTGNPSPAWNINHASFPGNPIQKHSVPKTLGHSMTTSLSTDLKDIIIITNKDDGLAAKVFQLRTGSLIICMKNNRRYTYSADVLKAAESLGQSIYICICSVTNREWLRDVAGFVTLQKNHIGNNAELQKAVGIRLLLFNGIQSRDLPTNLRLLRSLSIDNYFTEKDVTTVNFKLSEMHNKRKEHVINLIKSTMKELFFLVDVKVVSSASGDHLTSSELKSSYNIIVEILEDCRSMLRQDLQRRFKMPHVHVVDKRENDCSLTIEIRPSRMKQFMQFIVLCKQHEMEHIWMESVESINLLFKGRVKIEVNESSVSYIVEMLNEEQVREERRKLGDMLEKHYDVTEGSTLLERHSSKSQPEFMRTAKGMRFLVGLFENYLINKNRTPAEFLKLLSDRKCDWNILEMIRDNRSYPVLHMAVAAERTDFLEMCLYTGQWGKLRQQIIFPTEDVSYFGYTGRRTAESLCSTNSGHKVLKIFDECDWIWRTLSILCKCCSRGDFQFVRALTECDPSTLRYSENSNCLLYACGSGNTELVNYLFNKLCHFRSFDSQLRQCLTLAAKLGHRNIIRLICSKYVITNLSEPMSQCALNGDIESADVLDSRVISSLGTYIMLSSKNCQERFVDYFVKKHPGINVNEGADSEGLLALHHAARNGSLKLLKLLLLHGADLTALDKYKRNVLHLATEATQVLAAKMLIQKAQEDGCLNKLINQHDLFVGEDVYFLLRGKENGCRAWHWLKLKRWMIYGFKTNINQGHVKMSRFGEVIASGKGSNPGYNVSERVDTEKAELLRASHSDVTPLHLAVLQQCVPLVELLLKEGADPMVRDFFGCTPAHYAAMYGSLNILQLLENKGADLNCKSLENKTPAEVAEENGQMGAVNFIEGSAVMKRAQTFVDCLDLYTVQLSGDVLQHELYEREDLGMYIIDQLRNLQIDISLTLVDLGSGPVLSPET